MVSRPLLEVINLSKYFWVGSGQILKAVDNISFSIQRGKTLGLVGESGCGKTTVGRTIVRLYETDGGQVVFNGQDVHKAKKKDKKMLTQQMQMIFQDPYASLNPRITIGDSIGEGIAIHGLYNNKTERKARIYELLRMVGLDKEHANRFPHEFSGGQRQRVGIARALALNPEFIICDEPISALDVSIQAQIVNLLMSLQDRFGLTYLFIAHDLRMVQHISDETAVMYLGMLAELANTEEIYNNPLHPYTKGLLSAIPFADPHFEQARPRNLITGDVPSPINLKPGCRFIDRCPYASAPCKEAAPELREVEPGHFVACYHV